MPARWSARSQARDREIDNAYTKDAQVTAIRGARNYLGDKLIRVATPHRLLDPKAGPLIAVRLWVLTRKTLGGLQTDLSARVLKADGQPLGNVFAAGEVAGFGGGGMHGYRALEGTFLGGCIFSGRVAGARRRRRCGEPSGSDNDSRNSGSPLHGAHAARRKPSAPARRLASAAAAFLIAGLTGAPADRQGVANSLSRPLRPRADRDASG